MTDLLPLEIKQNPKIYFSGHRSIFANPGVFTKVHENSYAIKIKSNTAPLFIKNDESIEAYAICQATFFAIVEKITNEYGYHGFSVEGRSGGWLKPLVENKKNSYTFTKTISADTNDFISFNEYIVQKKFESYAEEIVKIKEIIETIFKYSTTIDELRKLLSETFERLI